MKKKTVIASFTVVLTAAVLAWSQYTPITREGALFSSGVTASVVYDGATAVSTMWYLAPAYHAVESYSIYDNDFYTAGYIANAADTNVAGLTVINGVFSETADHGEWLVSVTDGDGDNLETIVVADDGGSGWLEITTNNKAADDVEVQKNGEAFSVTTSRDLWYETSIKIEDIDQDTAWWGLTVSDTDVLGSFGNDFMGFTYTATTNVAFQFAKNGTIVTNAAVTTVADATAKRFGFYVDGSASNIYVYVNGAAVATNTASASVPNDEALSPVFAIRTADTGADYLQVDYLKITQTR